MDSWMLAKNRLRLRSVVSGPFGICKIKRLGVVFLLFLLIVTSGYALAASQPGAQKLVNPDLEQGTMNGWGWQGAGWGGVENCCGQHNTPFWGTGTNPYLPQRPGVFSANTWDGGVDLGGGTTQLYQYSSVSAGQRYRMSSWMFTSGVTAKLRRYSPNTQQYTDCAATADTSHTPLACEFTANSSENLAFMLEATGNTGQWAVSDDWTLTPIVTVPRIWLADTWSTLPVAYYVDPNAYATRTDIAAWSWNNAMGKSMLQKTGNANQNNVIKVLWKRDPGDDNTATTQVRKDAQGNMIIMLNKFWMDPWNSATYRYGFEARERTIAHEFGHALGLDHVQNECELMLGVAAIAGFNCNAFKPTSGDVAGMRAIYP